MAWKVRGKRVVAASRAVDDSARINARPIFTHRKAGRRRTGNGFTVNRLRLDRRSVTAVDPCQLGAARMEKGGRIQLSCRELEEQLCVFR